jgi:hypothetical protein
VYAQQTTWLPTTPKGLGQACAGTICADGSVMDSSCVCGGGGLSLPTLTSGTCFNTATMLEGPCPVAGSVQTGAPSTNGPFGAMTFSNLNWGVLAAVLGGLVLVASMSGGKH